jgi:hypothetical protein
MTASTATVPVWLTPAQVADRYGFTEAALEKQRYRRQGFPFYNPTGGKVLYKQSEIDAYIEASRQEVRP